MFDEQNQKNQNKDQASQAPDSNQAQDMFAETDNNFSPKPSEDKENSSFDPKDQLATSLLPNNEKSTKQAVDLPEQFSVNTEVSGSKKYFKIILIIIAVMFIAAALASAGWYLYKKNMPGDDTATNLNTNDLVTNSDNMEVLQPNTNIDQNSNNINIHQNENTNDSVNANIDSDFDGLTDGEEKELNTNPASADSDQDNLLDREEVKIYKTDPLNADTDGDGYLDGQEVRGGYNPLGSGRLDDIEN